MAHTSTASILFCDLVGSTERFIALGDDAADVFIRQFLAACARVVEEHHGEVVKTLGDGMMAVFERGTLDAIEAAVELHDAVAALDQADPPRLRIGLSVAEVSLEGGDWYGRPVIEAARLCSDAATGTTLATEVVRAVLGNRGEVSFVPAGSRRLRGLPEPVAALRVEPVASAAPSSPGARTTPDGVGPRRRGLRPVVLAGLAVALVGGAVAAATWSGAEGDRDRPTAGTDRPGVAYRPRFVERPCPKDQADPTRTCGVLRVPLDRSRPKGRWIDVPLDSWAPVGTRKDHVALEINSLVDPNQAPTRLLGRQIRLGVRGREGTPLLNCPEVTQAGVAHLLDPLYSEPAVSAHVSTLRTCRQRWIEQGVDVARFSNEDVAADVVDAVRALRLPRLDLISGTDQTHAAFALLRDHADLLRTVTLVNPEAPDMSSGQLVLSFKEAMERYTDLCRADATCNAALPDPLGRWRLVYDQLQATPSLQSGQLPDGTRFSMVVDGDRGASALEVAVGSVPLTPYLHLTLTGDSAAAAAGNAYEKSDTSDLVPIGADLSDICHRLWPNDAAIDGDWIRRFPEYRSGRFRLVAESCDAWNVPIASKRFRSAVVSDVPTTIVVGRLSTATNAAAVDGIVRGLDRAVLFAFPSLGFAPMFDAPSCFPALWRTWLADPAKVPSQVDVDACVASTPPVTFFGSS